jgi:hypothetical protein
MRIAQLVLLGLAIGGGIGVACGTERDEVSPSSLEQAQPHGYFQPGPRLGARPDGASRDEPSHCPPSTRRDGSEERAADKDHAAQPRGLAPGLQPAPSAVPGPCLSGTPSTTGNPATAPSRTK